MSAVGTCLWCNHRTGPDDAFCSRCGAPATATPAAGVELAAESPGSSGDATFHVVELVEPATHSSTPTPTAGPANWKFALISLAALAVGALAALAFSGPTAEPSPDAGSIDEAQPVAPTAPLAPASAPLIPAAAGTPAGPLAFEVIWSDGPQLNWSQPAGDPRWLRLEHTIDSGPVRLGDDVVITSDGRALIIDGNVGTTAIRDVGEADLVLPSGRTDTYWRGLIVREGESADLPPLFAPPPGRVRWTEVDAQGNVLRAATREPELDFGTPDLVWGFQSTIYRLSDRTRHPWRFISPGYPVAVGPNDVILNVCSSDRAICERRWFDARTGEPGGPLLDTIADNFAPHHGGRLSPDGRWAITETTADGVQIHALSTGATIEHECRSTDIVAWSGDGLLACQGPVGVTIQDLTTGISERAEIVDSGATIAVRRLGT